ncbi:hypothetical protein, partial [Endothiovibrio diazotrophicus]
GQLVFERDGIGGHHLAIDGSGGVWVGEGSGLVRIDRDGIPLLHLQPFGDAADGAITALVSDYRDGGVWVLSAL